MKLEEYINLKLEIYEKQLKHSESLDKECVGREVFIAKEREAIRVLKEIKAHMEAFANQ